MKPFVTHQLVRFGHVDPAGIAYFPKIFDYVHEAFEDLWHTHFGIEYYSMIIGQGIGYPLVHSDVDFEHPLRFGDRPEVHVTCFHLGRSSLGLRYRYFVDGVRCLRADMTVVRISLETYESLPIPDDYRAKFEEIREPREDQ